MKDRQVTAVSTEPQILLVSPILHCVSMTALVYLRSNFGYSYLRPKSIFIAISWAFALYATYAWVDGTAWHEHRIAIWFGVSAAILYYFHLLRAIQNEWRETAKHDNYAGTPYPLIMVKRDRAMSDTQADQRWCLWGEPAVAFFSAVFLFVIFNERHLSIWLLIVTICLWTKETINQWFGKRRRKRYQDTLEDTRDTIDNELTNNASQPSTPTVISRKAKVNRRRTNTLTTSEAVQPKNIIL